MKEPIFTYLKKAEKNTHKIRLPFKFVEKYGENYYMDVYDGYVVIRPIGEKSGQNNNNDKH